MFEERARAERAMEGLASADGDDITSREWPAAAVRIRDARLLVGLSEKEVAHRLGIGLDSYWDLEFHDDEIFTVVSLKTLEQLGRVLQVEPRVLLLGPEAERFQETVTFAEISTRLANQLTERGLTADQLGDIIGWDIVKILRDPNALWDYYVDTLFDISKSLGICWIDAVPML